MILFQISALAISIVYIFYWFFRDRKFEDFIVRYFTIAVASWICEETSIRVYHFYQYSQNWIFFLGHVPILVIVIWPLVIHSGWELASGLLQDKRTYIPLVVGCIVGIDASLIETISVKAGLWSWNGAGPFGVPLIGIFGWAYFAFFSALALERRKEGAGTVLKSLYVLVTCVAGTHAMIVATWWLFFRWNFVSLNSVFLTALAWIISMMLIYSIHRRRLGIHMDKRVLMMRVPPVLFFFVLYLKSRPDGLHTSYLTAFALPYIFLLYKLSRKRLL